MQLFEFDDGQLDAFIKDEGSGVTRVPTKVHLGVPPYCLNKLDESLLKLTSKNKVGKYDAKSKGIVLCVRNIRLSDTSPQNTVIRHDSPHVHLDLLLDYYVFRPRVAAVLRGTVKHIWKRHVSALIYNVFSVSIRLQGNFKAKLQVGKPIAFRVGKFDLENSLPFIEGDLIEAEEEGGEDGADGKDTLPHGNGTTANGHQSSSEDEQDEKPQKPIAKREAKSPVSASGESSSSSSEDEEFVIPAPKVSVVVKRETSVSRQTKQEKESPRKQTTKADAVVVVKKEKTETLHSSDDDDESSSSSDEDELRVPTPKVSLVDGKVVIKQEMPPPKRNKKQGSSDASSASESDAGKLTTSLEKAKKRVLQSPSPSKKAAQSTPKQAKKAKTSVSFAEETATRVKKEEEAPRVGESSSEDEDDEFSRPAVNVSAETKKIVAQVLSKKMKVEKKTPVPPRKRKSSTGSESAKAQRKANGVSLLTKDDLAHIFDSIASPAKKKAKG